MALRTITTERQRRLGAELKKLREQAGLNVADGGAFIGMGRAHLSHVEAGRTAIPADKLRKLCHSYRCTSAPYVDALVSMSETDGKGWWTEYRRLLKPSALDLAELEAAANSLASYESLFIPGVLQIADYTRAIFRSSQQDWSDEDREKAVQFRMDRQKILTSEQPPALHAVIHESALHVRFGNTDVRRRQLLHLVRMAKLSHVTIQVLPFTAEGLSAFSTPFMLVESHQSALHTVLAETHAASAFLHDTDSVTKYRSHFDRLAAAALPPLDPDIAAYDHGAHDSLGLVQHILYTLREH